METSIYDARLLVMLSVMLGEYGFARLSGRCPFTRRSQARSLALDAWLALDKEHIKCLEEPY